MLRLPRKEVRDGRYLGTVRQRPGQLHRRQWLRVPTARRLNVRFDDALIVSVANQWPRVASVLLEMNSSGGMFSSLVTAQSIAVPFTTKARKKLRSSPAAWPAVSTKRTAA